PVQAASNTTKIVGKQRCCMWHLTLELSRPAKRVRLERVVRQQLLDHVCVGQRYVHYCYRLTNVHYEAMPSEESFCSKADIGREIGQATVLRNIMDMPHKRRADATT